MILLSFCAIVVVWIGAATFFLARNDERNRDGPTLDHPDPGTPTALESERILALDLVVDPVEQATITVRISVFVDECPKAYEFLTWMIDNQEAECRPCTVYRGEPVPPYWGSEDYPDRWDNGGRWGPPYALVQGGFPNRKVTHVEREEHRPPVERGMVAWAGPRGTHFFVALADHPEWGHEHTVWGRVLEEDMPSVDALVRERPLNVLEHNVPIVTNFVNPMPFRIRRYP
ncbi:hypothetical protein ACHAWF_010012 [Thalassiosira exigua]